MGRSRKNKKVAGQSSSGDAVEKHWNESIEFFVINELLSGQGSITTDHPDLMKSYKRMNELLDTIRISLASL